MQASLHLKIQLLVIVEVGLRHRQMMESGIDKRHRGNMMVNGVHNTVRNCVFRYVVDAYIFRFKKSILACV